MNDRPLPARAIAAIFFSSATALTAPAQTAPPPATVVEAFASVQVGDTWIDLGALQGLPPASLQIHRIRAGVTTSVFDAPVTTRALRVPLVQPAATGDRYVITMSGGNGPATASELRTFDSAGDFNGDGVVNIADATTIIDYLMLGDRPTRASDLCGDCNGDTNLDLADAIYLLEHLFQNGPAPQPLATGAAIAPIGITTAPVIAEFITALQTQTHIERADYAYLRLAHMGDTAVPALIAAAATVDPTLPCQAERCFHPMSSQLHGRPRVASVLLCLVEAIRTQRSRPFLHPELHGASGLATSAELAQAVTDFVVWDQQHTGVPVSSRPAPQLSGGVTMPTAIAPSLTGLAGATPMAILPQTAPLRGLPGPHVDPNNPHAMMRYMWVQEDPESPPIEGSNCMLWALRCLIGCEMWFRDGHTLADLMGHEGFEGPDDWPSPVWENVAVIHWLCPGQEPSAETAVHFLRQGYDGKWKSKNGTAGPFVDGIDDLWNWLLEGNYLPDDPTKTLHVEYYWLPL
ncbi:MAG: dockerin type I repeat-containing protein [bacterium]|nr:dockerin type I repeat-containing protein [bacterium]